MSGLFNEASLVLVPSGYKAGKVYSQVPTNGNGDLTFTRASSATRVNSDGLIESPRTNLVTTSVGNLIAIGGGVVEENAAIAPDGTLTAEKLTFGSTLNDGATLGITSAVVGSTLYQLSFYAKNVLGDGNYQIRIDTNTTALLVTQSLTATSEWQRVVVSFTTDASATSIGSNSRFRVVTANNQILFWGFQLEKGSTATDYIPTTNSARTTFAGITQDGTSASNVPRLDYSQGSCPALLLEPQRTNLVLNSATFVTQTITVTANPHTLSFTGTGTIVITGVGSGTLVGTGVNDRVSLSFTTTAGSLILTGTGTITLAQFEAGAYPTSYIPTTSATVTRLADSFSRNNIYTNGLITSSGGTLFVELKNNVLRTLTTETVSAGLELGNSAGNATDAFKFRRGGGTSRINIWKVVSGASTVVYNLLTDTAKVVIKWNGTSADVFVNGTKVVSATSFTATTSLEFVRYIADQMPTFIQQMALYPTPLSDSDCISLTTL